MPTNYLTLDTIQFCDDADSHAEIVTLPCVIDCDKTDDQCGVAPCDEHWNCNLCDEEKKYSHPFIAGDKIWIQTQFVDPTNTEDNFTDGWGTWINATLTDGAGNTISSTIGDFASDYMVGWNGTFYYQIIVIDTGLFYDDCWVLEIAVDDPSGQETWCSGLYEKVDCGEPWTYTLEGDYPDGSTDCCNNYYGLAPDNNWVGTNNFRFRNLMRLRGQVLDAGGTITKEIIRAGRNQRVMREKVQTIPYKLVSHDLLPPYVKNMMLRGLGGEPIYVDGEEYIADTVTIGDENRVGRMLAFDVVVNKECETGYPC